MTRWLKHLLPVGILLVVLALQPLWLLVALLLPGIVIIKAASAVASLLGADRIATGIQFSIPLLDGTALGLEPIAAIGFWALTSLLLVATRDRNRRREHQPR